MTTSDIRSCQNNPAGRMAEATQWVKRKATELGFDLVGVAPAGRFPHADAFLAWLHGGRAGTMQYMHRFVEQRTDSTVLLEGARTVIAVACSYKPAGEDAVDATPALDHDGQGRSDGDSAATHAGRRVPTEVPSLRQEGEAAAVAARGRIARYALGEDYHEMMKVRLHGLADAIRERFLGEATKCCVDITPILEREAAAMAGLGWIGKNNCLINPDWGSWVVLGEVVTTLGLEPDSPRADLCGTCTRCIDACPTGAITAPHQIDARKCITYLTLEHRETLMGDQRQQVGDWLVGCDACQECCPWNDKARPGRHAEFASRFAARQVGLQSVLNWTEEDYRRFTRGSAIRRVKLPILKDRASAIIANLRG